MGVCASDLPALTGGVPGSGTIAAYVWDGTNFVPADPAMQFTGYNASTASIRAGTLVQFSESNGLWVVASATEWPSIWHATAVDDIAPGASGTVVLSDASQIEATNWSDGVDISTSDKIHVYQDSIDSTYYAIRVPPPQPRRFKGTLYENLAYNAATAKVTALAALDGGSTPAAPLTVQNLFDLAGETNDDVLVTEDLSGAGTDYLLEQIKHKAMTDGLVLDVKTDSPTDPTKIEQTRRTLLTVAGVDDSADTKVIDFALKTVVVDVDVDSSADPTVLNESTIAIMTIERSAWPITTVPIVALEFEEVVTDVTVTGTGSSTVLNKLYKTVTVWPSTTTEQGPAVILSANTTQVVTDMIWDGTTLTEYYEDIHYFGGAPDSSGSGALFATVFELNIVDVYLAGLSLYYNYNTVQVFSKGPIFPELILSGTTCEETAAPNASSAASSEQSNAQLYDAVLTLIDHYYYQEGV